MAAGDGVHPGQHRLPGWDEFLWRDSLSLRAQQNRRSGHAVGRDQRHFDTVLPNDVATDSPASGDGFGYRSGGRRAGPTAGQPRGPKRQLRPRVLDPTSGSQPGLFSW